MDKLGDFLDTSAGMVGFLTTASIIGLNILGTKIRENKIAKENNTLQSEINLNKLKEQKSESDTLILQKRSVITEKKKLIEKKKGTVQDLKELKITLEKKKADKTLTAEEAARLKTIDASIAKEEKGLEKAQAELAIAEQELQQEEARNGIINDNIKLQEAQKNNVLGLQGALSGIVSILGVAFSIFQGIAMVSGLIVKLKDKEYRQTVRNTIATKAQAAAEQIKAAFGMAGSASAIPVAG